MNTLFRGFWSSTMATSSMTLSMFQFFSELPRAQKKPLPPAQLTQSVEKKIGIEPAISNELHEELSLLSHYGYGALCGIAYATLASKVPGNALLKGSIFGLGVWATSYLGLIPKLRLEPAATEMNSQRNAMMIASHVVWGAALAIAEESLRKNSSGLLGKRT